MVADTGRVTKPNPFAPFCTTMLSSRTARTLNACLCSLRLTHGRKCQSTGGGSRQARALGIHAGWTRQIHDRSNIEKFAPPCDRSCDASNRPI